MIIKTAKPLPSSEITDQTIFVNRRRIIKAMMAATALASSLKPQLSLAVEQHWPGLPNSFGPGNSLTTTPAKLVKNYTNYYEFSFNKEDSTKLAQKLPIDPWSVTVSGEVEKPGVYDLADLLRRQTLEERIYRFRCVEGWSMVVPWLGFPLSNLLKEFRPLSAARFVKFTTVFRPEVMPKQQANAMLNWPYVEGLRIDEAMHPLTLLAVGMYGDTLPKQNGAPLRLVVPWKYGFKSIKAIVKIELLRNAPLTTWNQAAPDEYGFYANVNPDVPHPRWSQRSERLLGSHFFSPRRTTEIFNGYGEQVASLYREMNLQHFY